MTNNYTVCYRRKKLTVKPIYIFVVIYNGRQQHIRNYYI